MSTALVRLVGQNWVKYLSEFVEQDYLFSLNQCHGFRKLRCGLPKLALRFASGNGVPSIDGVIGRLNHLALTKEADWSKWHILLKQFTSYGDALSSKQLALCCNAVVRGPFREKETIDAIAKICTSKLAQFNDKDLGCAANAFARLGVGDSELFNGIADVILSKEYEVVARFSPQNLALILNSYAKLGFRRADLFIFIRSAVVSSVNKFNAQELSMVASAYSRNGCFDQHLFHHLSEAIQASVGAFTPQDLSNCCNAFSRVKYDDHNLYNSLKQRIVETASDFNVPHISMALNAFGKLHHSEIGFEVLQALMPSVKGLIKRFEARNVANVANAYAKLYRGQVVSFGLVYIQTKPL